METHRCTHTYGDKGNRSYQCYHNGAYSHSSVNIDVGLSTQWAQEGVVRWSFICKWIITIIWILLFRHLLLKVCPVNKITYTKWHKSIYTRKVCQMRKTCILHQISLYVTVTKPILTLILLTWRIWWAPNNASRWQMGFNSAFKGLMAFTVISEDILFVSCIHWQTFLSLWPQKTWQEYTRSCLKWKCLYFFVSDRSSSIL